MATELDQSLILEFKAAARQAAADLEAWLAALPTDPAVAQRITTLAHQLRGAGGAYGFPAVSAAAGKLEESGRRGLPGRVKRLLGELVAVQEAPLPAPPAAPEPTAVPNRAVRILIVDDDRLTVSLVRDRLERAGHRVDHQLDGVEALEAAKDTGYDLIVIDVKMPRLDGFSVVKQLRASARHAKTPVLMLTALGGAQDAVRGFELGVDDYMRKPFSPAELMARIDRLLARPAR